VDDCAKFVKREINRGHRYDAIIMDPPSYGRGPSGELWRFEDNIYDFVELCAGVLSDQPLFVIISSYTAGVSPSVPEYILGRTVRRRFGGRTESGELGLPVESTGMALPCGHTTRWIGEGAWNDRSFPSNISPTATRPTRAKRPSPPWTT
jgi:23S rRNA (cytosine1962-C5)-methyltransferase